MKDQLRLLFLCVVFTSFGQEHGGLLTKETLVKNRVHTIFQYNASDSVQFMTDYPNGYYSVFNEEGEMVKSNNYSLTYSGPNGEPIWEEYNNFYFYNDAGEKIGFIQMFVDADEPFRMISLTSEDPLSKKLYSVNMEPDTWGETVFVIREENSVDRRLFFGDTISIAPDHKRSFCIKDSTLFEDIYFNATNRIDSTIFHSTNYGKRGTEPSFLTTYYHYHFDGTIKNKTRFYRSKTRYSTPSSITKVNYNEKGLIESIETQSSSNDSRELMKYTYTFRE